MTDQYDAQTEMQAIHKQVWGWFDAFVGSPEYQRLTEIHKEKAPGIIRFFTEYSFRYIGAAPEQWNRGVLAECCVEILPRKMSAGMLFFEAVAPVLSAFFDFLAGKGLMSKARELSAAVAEMNAEIVAASQDERNWGPAKAFIMAAEKAGVDTCDQGAMDRFLIEHNLRLAARLEALQAAAIPSSGSAAAAAAPIRHAQPKLGRNALCPCGSGKKSKKCCG